jgi:hypothetical protein
VTPNGSPLQAGEGVGLSADGRFGWFTSVATDLGANDNSVTSVALVVHGALAV